MTGKKTQRSDDAELVARLVRELGDAEPDVRRAAAAALGEIGYPQAVPALAAAVGDSDASVRLAVVEALGRLGGPAVVPALMDALRDPDERVRDAANFGLSE